MSCDEPSCPLLTYEEGFRKLYSKEGKNPASSEHLDYLVLLAEQLDLSYRTQLLQDTDYVILAPPQILAALLIHPQLKPQIAQNLLDYLSDEKRKNILSNLLLKYPYYTPYLTLPSPLMLVFPTIDPNPPSHTKTVEAAQAAQALHHSPTPVYKETKNLNHTSLPHTLNQATTEALQPPYSILMEIHFPFHNLYVNHLQELATRSSFSTILQNHHHLQHTTLQGTLLHPLTLKFNTADPDHQLAMLEEIYTHPTDTLTALVSHKQWVTSTCPTWAPQISPTHYLWLIDAHPVLVEYIPVPLFSELEKNHQTSILNYLYSFSELANNKNLVSALMGEFNGNFKQLIAVVKKMTHSSTGNIRI